MQLVYDVIETPEGDFIVVGSVGNNSESQVYVQRLNDLGETLDSDLFGGLENDVAYEIIRDADGGYVIAGKKGDNSNFYVIRLIEVGADLVLDWAEEYGLSGFSEEAKSIVQTKGQWFCFSRFHRSRCRPSSVSS